MDAGKPPKMPLVEIVESTNGPPEGLDIVDSPVGGLVDSPSPFVDASKVVEMKKRTEDSSEGDLTPLKSALSTDMHGNKRMREGVEESSCLKRNVSWADFHDAAALTTVVEFERDPAPSSPTSIDSWEGTPDSGCVCCSIQ